MTIINNSGLPIRPDGAKVNAKLGSQADLFAGQAPTKVGGDGIAGSLKKLAHQMQHLDSSRTAIPAEDMKKIEAYLKGQKPIGYPDARPMYGMPHPRPPVDGIGDLDPGRAAPMYGAPHPKLPIGGIGDLDPGRAAPLYGAAFPGTPIDEAPGPKQPAPIYGAPFPRSPIDGLDPPRMAPMYGLPFPREPQLPLGDDPKPKLPPKGIDWRDAAPMYGLAFPRDEASDIRHSLGNAIKDGLKAIGLGHNGKPTGD